MKMTKPALWCAAVFTVVALLNSCKSYEEKPIQDCSAIFETRDAYNNKVKEITPAPNSQAARLQPATECKVLEVKIDDNVKCEIVGSDKVDNLSTALENSKDKIILITPEDQVGELLKKANTYLKFSDIEVKKYLDSELFKNNLNFAYKGMRCETANKKYVVWSGNKKVIFTIENK